METIPPQEVLDTMLLRGPLSVRSAEVEDAAGLIELAKAVTLNVEDDRDRWISPGDLESLDPTAAAQILEFNRRRNGRHVVVALCGGQIVGVAAADVTTYSLIVGPRILILTDLQVHPDQRRRSVAAVLLKAMAARAEEEDCEMVVASLPSWAKEANRFLAKIGFNQVAVLRAIPLARLHAKLATKSSGSRETGRLVAMRRSLRRRNEAVTEG